MNLQINSALKSGETITVEGFSDRNGTCVLKRDGIKIDSQDFTIQGGDPSTFTVTFLLESDPAGATYSVVVSQEGADGKVESANVTSSPENAPASPKGTYGRP